MNWSPDSKYLAFTIALPTNEERKITVPNYLGKYVVASPARNDFAGDPAPEISLGITETESNSTTWIDHGYGDDKRCYYLSIAWSPESKNLLIDKTAEDFHKRNLFLAAPEGPGCSIVFEEHKDTWVDVYNQQSQFSDDGKFILTDVRCLGCCAKAPAIMIDGEVYGDLDEERVIEALERYRG